jgi:ribosomal protein S18 acetylase RimI-like enzyme
VALLPLDEYTCELKRMWVSSGFRGQKVGWSLTEHLIAKARAMGYTKMELSTHIALRQAQRIYLGQGFEIVDAPEDAPPIMKELAVFMSLDLT